MSPRIYDARSADAMAIDASSSDPKAVAPRRLVSTTITVYRSPMAGRRRSIISNCAALRTTRSKRSGGSGRCSSGRPVPVGAYLVRTKFVSLLVRATTSGSHTIDQFHFVTTHFPSFLMSVTLNTSVSSRRRNPT
jgi:hypothetical protein